MNSQEKPPNSADGKITIECPDCRACALVEQHDLFGNSTCFMCPFCDRIYDVTFHVIKTEIIPIVSKQRKCK